MKEKNVENNNDLIVLNIQEAADYLGGLSIHTLYAYSSKGKIPKLKHSGRLMFSKDDLNAFMEKNRVKAML